MKYAVLVKNFQTKSWDIMNLVFDPRTKGRGQAIYDTKEEAEFTMSIAESLGGRYIKMKVEELSPTPTPEGEEKL